MNWISQVLGFFVAFGPVLVLIALWHLIWSDNSGSGGGGGGTPRHDPPPSGPTHGYDRAPVEQEVARDSVAKHAADQQWHLN
ncbi:MAG: hypothetical protein R6U20_00430 [Longimonas sp.]|uniref:hypothetical protein n=1 Tax=Longimonas sp. TaxID=2039626 RepID=UPI003975AA1C